jgi:hypothetical protein
MMAKQTTMPTLEEIQAFLYSSDQSGSGDCRAFEAACCD